MPRELRRSVLLPARMRTPTGWSDACILNVSSRGMMIHAKTSPPDDTIELRHNEFAFVLEIVWRNGTRVGVRSTERLPVEDILTVSESACLRLTAERRAGRAATSSSSFPNSTSWSRPWQGIIQTGAG